MKEKSLKKIGITSIPSSLCSTLDRSRELWIGLIELGIGLIELEIGLRIVNDKVSGLSVVSVTSTVAWARLSVSLSICPSHLFRGHVGVCDWIP